MASEVASEVASESVIATLACSGPECNADAKQACSRCQLVAYCGKLCQRRHWPAHRLECARAKLLAPRGKEPSPNRLCMLCRAAHDPLMMHPCKICGILYCDAECAFKHWKRHKLNCLAGRDMVFATDVTHALRTAHLTVYVYCDCGCRRTQISPRAQRLELDPLVAVRSCTFARLGRPSAEAGELTMRLAEKESRLRAEREMASYQELYDEFSKRLSPESSTDFNTIIVDEASVRRLWKTCRLTFKILVRTPRAEWNSMHLGLSQQLRHWCAIGQMATATLLAQLPPPPKLTLRETALLNESLLNGAKQDERAARRSGVHDLQIAFTATKVTAAELWA
jgi:hypothetical protein